MATSKKTNKVVDESVVEEKVVEKTEAERIWDKIKDLPIDVYALPDQVVRMHARREEKLEKAFPDTLHLALKSGAVRHALEECLGRVRLGKNEFGQPLSFLLTDVNNFTTIKIVPRDI